MTFSGMVWLQDLTLRHMLDTGQYFSQSCQELWCNHTSKHTRPSLLYHTKLQRWTTNINFFTKNCVNQSCLEHVHRYSTTSEPQYDLNKSVVRTLPSFIETFLVIEFCWQHFNQFRKYVDSMSLMIKFQICQYSA